MSLAGWGQAEKDSPFEKRKRLEKINPPQRAQEAEGGERPCPRHAPCVAAADGHGGGKGHAGEGLRSNDPAAAAPGPERGLPPSAVHPQHACLGAGGLLPEDGLPERLRLDAVRLLRDN